MNITTIGIDLAKTVFQTHGVDECGKVVLRKAVKLMAPQFVKPYVKTNKSLSSLRPH
jgi:transposase